MTARYEWNPMPHVVDVICPTCGGLAVFEFAEVVRIRRKADVDFFRRSRVFDYEFVHGGRCGSWHAAIYFHGLHRRALPSEKDVPPGYAPDDWAHSRYWVRSCDVGTIRCSRCRKNLKHTLDWPHDAYFQARVAGEVLWAFNRESLCALRDYIASADRKRPVPKPWGSFLDKVPTRFLRAKVRETAIKKLERLLLPVRPPAL